MRRAWLGGSFLCSVSFFFLESVLSFPVFIGGQPSVAPEEVAPVVLDVDEGNVAGIVGDVPFRVAVVETGEGDVCHRVELLGAAVVGGVCAVGGEHVAFAVPTVDEAGESRSRVDQPVTTAGVAEGGGRGHPRVGDGVRRRIGGVFSGQGEEVASVVGAMDKGDGLRVEGEEPVPDAEIQDAHALGGRGRRRRRGWSRRGGWCGCGGCSRGGWVGLLVGDGGR